MSIFFSKISENYLNEVGSWNNRDNYMVESSLTTLPRKKYHLAKKKNTFYEFSWAQNSTNLT